MKYKVSFDIVCGETTCCNPDTKIFCVYFRGSLNNKNNCYLFGPVDENEKGWIARHPLCLKIAIKTKSEETDE